MAPTTHSDTYSTSHRLTAVCTVLTQGSPQLLIPGGEFVCTAIYKLTQWDVDAGEVHNLATVTGVAQDGKSSQVRGCAFGTNKTISTASTVSALYDIFSSVCFPLDQRNLRTFPLPQTPAPRLQCFKMFRYYYR